MSDIPEDIIYPWMRLLMSAGSVEIGLHPAESWNEGVTGKRYKQKKINLATVTTRIGGWTVSGPPDVAKEVFQGLQLLGFFDGMTVTWHQAENCGPKLHIYIDRPKA